MLQYNDVIDIIARASLLPTVEAALYPSVPAACVHVDIMRCTRHTAELRSGDVGLFLVQLFMLRLACSLVGMMV